MESGRSRVFGPSFVTEHNGWNRQQQLAYLRSSLEGEAASVLWDYGDEVTGSLSRLTATLQLEVWTKDSYRLQQAGTPRSMENERNREITKPSQPTALEKESEALQKEMAEAKREIEEIRKKVVELEIRMARSPPIMYAGDAAGNVREPLRCFRCREIGHYIRNCPNHLPSRITPRTYDPNIRAGSVSPGTYTPDNRPGPTLKIRPVFKQYDYEAAHRLRKRHGNADGLSRKPDRRALSDIEEEDDEFDQEVDALPPLSLIHI